MIDWLATMLDVRNPIHFPSGYVLWYWRRTPIVLFGVHLSITVRTPKEKYIGFRTCPFVTPSNATNKTVTKITNPRKPTKPTENNQSRPWEWKTFSVWGNHSLMKATALGGILQHCKENSQVNSIQWHETSVRFCSDPLCAFRLEFLRKRPSRGIQKNKTF